MSDLVERVKVMLCSAFVAGSGMDDGGELARAVLAEIAQHQRERRDIDLCIRIDSLTRELAASQQEARELDALSRTARSEKARADTAMRANEGLAANGDRLVQELVEAREELRILSDFVTDYRLGYCAQLLDNRLETLDAHRAKTSGAGAFDVEEVPSVDASNPGRFTSTQGDRPTPAPVSYETAPRLTKGVRYRVVDGTSSGLFSNGHEFVASGREIAAPESWFIIDEAMGGLHRVVRVKPEKAETVNHGYDDDCNGKGGKTNDNH